MNKYCDGKEKSSRVSITRKILPKEAESYENRSFDIWRLTIERYATVCARILLSHKERTAEEFAGRYRKAILIPEESLLKHGLEIQMNWLWNLIQKRNKEEEEEILHRQKTEDPLDWRRTRIELRIKESEKEIRFLFAQAIINSIEERREYYLRHGEGFHFFTHN